MKKLPLWFQADQKPTHVISLESAGRRCVYLGQFVGREKKCSMISKRPSSIDSHSWLHLRITWGVFKILDSQAAHEVNNTRSQRCRVERGRRARRQTFSGLGDFCVLPGLALVTLRVLGRSPQLIALLGAWQAPQTEANLKISHLQPVTQSSSLSRDRLTGFVDLAREVVMASQATLSTSHYISTITLPGLNFRCTSFYLYQIQHFRAWSKSAAKWTMVLFLSLP